MKKLAYLSYASPQAWTCHVILLDWWHMAGMLLPCMLWRKQVRPTGASPVNPPPSKCNIARVWPHALGTQYFFYKEAIAHYNFGNLWAKQSDLSIYNHIIKGNDSPIHSFSHCIQIKVISVFCFRNSWNECAFLCAETEGCKYWTFNNGKCSCFPGCLHVLHIQCW
jgi:hypothetical protein